MAQAGKRISASSVNWAKLADRLTPSHQAELNKLRGQNSTFTAQVNLLPGELPKVNFAELKKQMPSHAAVLDSLQKQYEKINIPYGTIPEQYNADAGKWAQYNDTRMKLQAAKAADGAVEAKKLEDKWAKAPPVEQFTRQDWPKYFPERFYDLRDTDPISIDPMEVGFNTPEARAKMAYLHGDYKVRRDPDSEH
ncbi:ATP synthase D chain, mitochondrial (ATP5H) domain-containing protein [Ditylenchus destructor]|uniref:ATP synthase D chain, mitochondrial (ATP5H) domain-containing protein n=1 Tax=Ditylenchus destructor TaxID=166010 RepID=A0AAD4MPM0_9BILA|nr:ATP synthase D chain, mitochondrial (ATP5H) domain-containing protein [Ditylenchus destructor]